MVDKTELFVSVAGKFVPIVWPPICVAFGATVGKLALVVPSVIGLFTVMPPLSVNIFPELTVVASEN